jgi:hypothetical protein
MKITVFTSNQPRHVALIESLAGIADEVFAIQECNTLFPGSVADFFRKSDVMQNYFRRVIDAERDVFGTTRFLPDNVRQMAIKMGDLNSLGLGSFGKALDADVFVVFGASYIKGDLCDLLVRRRAYNIHMGVSPYYRGSSCNFWAMYDRRPEMVGATIHLLSRGLDSGDILFHALPPNEPTEPFRLGMLAVRSAHASVVAAIRSGGLAQMPTIAQDRSKEVRCTRNADFTDAVAEEYLARLSSPAEIGAVLNVRDNRRYILV